MSKGPLWEQNFAVAFDQAPLVIAELRSIAAVAMSPAPTWVGDRIRFYVDLDELADSDELACVELAIRRACERAVGLHVNDGREILGMRRR